MKNENEGTLRAIMPSSYSLGARVREICVGRPRFSTKMLQKFPFELDFWHGDRFVLIKAYSDGFLSKR